MESLSLGCSSQFPVIGYPENVAKSCPCVYLHLGCLFNIALIFEIPIIKNKITVVGRLNLCLFSIPSSVY